MNRLGKILTLGLKKKQAWQLPIIAALLVLFAPSLRWYHDHVATRTFGLISLVETGDQEGVKWRLK